MKTTLAELTAAQFVDLICGDTSVLFSKNEIPKPEKLAHVLREIVMEYKSIVDPGAMKGYLMRQEELMKAKMSIVLFTICKNLIVLQQPERAREVLAEHGIGVESMSEERLKIEVKSRLARASKEYEQLRAEESDEEETDIRKQFDEQTAALMAYFKFQIDPTKIKATLYAHLICRHNREIKARLAAIKK